MTINLQFPNELTKDAKKFSRWGSSNLRKLAGLCFDNKECLVSEFVSISAKVVEAQTQISLTVKKGH